MKLQGGLGNQMFQYAFGKALSLELKQGLFLDHTLLGTNHHIANRTAREYELALFPELHAKLLPAFYKMIIGSESAVAIKLNKKFPVISKIRQVENEFVTVSRNALTAINVLEGYFQSEKYFLSFSDQIRAGFRFPPLDKENSLLKEQISKTNSLAIHIRRGDYFSNPDSARYHGILTIDYFTRAIEKVRKTQPKVHMFIFTDDTDWARLNLLNKYPEAIIAEGNTGPESWKDMALMTYAKHHIISNSSFSWWGAWLAGDQGIKIAPGRWFNPEVAKFDIHTIIPDNWTIL